MYISSPLDALRTFSLFSLALARGRGGFFFSRLHSLEGEEVFTLSRLHSLEGEEVFSFLACTRSSALRSLVDVGASDRRKTMKTLKL